MPADALGPEALDIDHEWTSADGRPLSAKFISLVGDQLTIAMNNGAKEFTLPLSKFSEESKDLANVLQKVAKKHRPAPPKPATPVAPKASQSGASQSGGSRFGQKAYMDEFRGESLGGILCLCG